MWGLTVVCIGIQPPVVALPIDQWVNCRAMGDAQDPSDEDGMGIALDRLVQIAFDDSQRVNQCRRLPVRLLPAHIGVSIHALEPKATSEGLGNLLVGGGEDIYGKAA